MGAYVVISITRIFETILLIDISTGIVGNESATHHQAVVQHIQIHIGVLQVFHVIIAEIPAFGTWGRCDGPTEIFSRLHESLLVHSGSRTWRIRETNDTSGLLVHYHILTSDGVGRDIISGMDMNHPVGVLLVV